MTESIRARDLPERVQWMRERPRRMMVGLHIADYDQLDGYKALKDTGKVAGILELLDPKALARELRKAHVQAFWFYSKGGFGNAFYPSKVGHVLSSLDGRDLFGEMCEACLREHILPLGIYECSDARVRTEHPEWCKLPLQHVSTGRLDVNDRDDLEVGSGCVMGPYGDYVIEQTLEVLKDYPIRAYYLDALGGGSGSGAGLCNLCAREFRNVFGYDFPGAGHLSPGDYAGYIRWRIEKMRGFTAKVRNLVKDVRPDVAFTYNYVGIRENCDFVTCDAFGFRQGSLSICSTMRRNAALSRYLPAEALLDSVHDDMRTAKALDQYRAETWTARSVNVATCGSFVMPTDGKVPLPQIRVAGKVFEEQAVYEPWLRDMEPVALVGILNGHDSRKYRPPEPDGFMADQPHHQLEYQGWVQAAIAGHQLWDYLEDQLVTRDTLRRFKVVVLPNASCLSKRQVTALRSYVREGGVLIATGETSLFNDHGQQMKNLQLSSVLGVRFKATRDRGRAFLALDDRRLRSGPEWVGREICFEGGQCLVTALPKAKVLARILEKPVFSQHEAANDLASVPVDIDAPGIVEQRYGKGRCYYVAGLPGLHWSQQGRNMFRRCMLNLLDLAVGKRWPVTLDGPESVELFAHRQKGKQHLVVNLVNMVWGCSRSVSGTRFEDIERMPRACDLRLRFRNRGKRKVKRVYLAPDRRTLRRRTQGGETEVKLDRLDVHAMVVAEYE